MLQENFRQFQVQEDALSKQEQDIQALQRETDAFSQVSCIYLPFWNCRNFDDDFLSLFIERGVQKSKGVKETLDKKISEAEETLKELKEGY